jgi:hypothetical protein
MWDFGAGSNSSPKTSTSPTGQVTWSASDKYTVTLTIACSTGSPIPWSQTIDIRPPTEAPPVVSAVSPQEGPTTGGTNLAITGMNLTGATTVSFIGSTGVSTTTPNVESDTQLKVTSPPGSGTAYITVTTPAGTSRATANDSFTYVLVSACPTQPPTAIANSEYSQKLSVSGGVPPYTWGPVGPVGAGLNLSADGTVSTGTGGTVSSASSSLTFEARVTDAKGTTGGGSCTIPILLDVTSNSQGTINEGPFGALSFNGQATYKRALNQVSLAVALSVTPFCPLGGLGPCFGPTAYFWVNINGTLLPIHQFVGNPPSSRSTWSTNVSWTDTVSVDYQQQSPVTIQIIYEEDLYQSSSGSLAGGSYTASAGYSRGSNTVYFTLALSNPQAFAAERVNAQVEVQDAAGNTIYTSPPVELTACASLDPTCTSTPSKSWSWAVSPSSCPYYAARLNIMLSPALRQ